MDQGYLIDGSDFQWAGGIGSLNRHTCFNVTSLRGSTLSIAFTNIIFSQVTLLFKNFNVDFQNCTFVDISMNYSDSSYLNISFSRFTNFTKKNSISLNAIKEVSILDCNFANNFITFSAESHVSFITFYDIRNIVMRNIVVLGNQAKPPRNGSRSFILMENAEVFSVENSIFMKNKNFIILNIVNASNCEIVNSTFSLNNHIHMANMSIGAIMTAKSAVQISGSSFTSNIGGAIVSEDSNLTIDGCTFNGNLNNFDTYNIEGYLGTIMLIDGHTEISHCNFEDNMGGTGAAISIVSAAENISKTDCSLVAEHNYFTNNSAFLGGTMYLSWPCNVTLSNTHFVCNGRYQHDKWDTAFGGAIYVQTLDEDISGKTLPISTYQVKDSYFHHNAAHFSGGGIFTGCLSKVDEPKNLNFLCATSLTNVVINNNEFINNTVYGYGSAITAYADVDITGSLFIENVGFGGSILLYEVSCNLSNTTFINNVALYAGNVIYAEGSVMTMRHCLVKDQINPSKYGDIEWSGNIREIEVYGSMLIAEDIQIDLLVNNSENEITVMEFENAHNDVSVLLRNITFTCPTDHAVVYSSSRHLETACRVKERESCDLDTSFTMVCKRASSGSYIAGRGTFTIEDQVIDNKLPYYYTFNVSKECPVPGGNCTNTIRALPGYWGHYKPKTEVIAFTRCPPEICCTGDLDCIAIDSCNSNWKRKGILCSQCYSKHSEVLFSQKCIGNDKCNSVWILFVVPVLLVIILSLAILCDKTNEVVQLYVFLTRVIKPLAVTRTHQQTPHQKHFKMTKMDVSIPSSSHQHEMTGERTVHLSTSDGNESCPTMSTQNHMIGSDHSPGSTASIQNNNTRSDQSPNSTLSTQNDTTGGDQPSVMSALSIKTCWPYVMILVYMNQDMSVFHANLYDCSKHYKLLPDVISKLSLSNIFHFHIDALGIFLENICIRSLLGYTLSTISKELLKSLVYLIIYLLFPCWYLALCILVPCSSRCIKLKKYLDRINIKLRLLSGFVTLQLLIYQKLLSTAIKFVNCYVINEKNRLHLDATHICYEPWQIITWIYLCICIIPFPLFITVSSSMLKNKVIGSRLFIAGLLFPGLILPLCFVLCWRNGMFKQTPNSRTNPPRQLGIEERTEDEPEDAERSNAVHMQDIQEETAPDETIVKQVDEREEELEERSPLMLNHGIFYESTDENDANNAPATVSDNNEETDDVRLIIQPNDEDTNDKESDQSLSEIIIDNLQNSYKHMKFGINWLGITLLFRLTLVLCSLLIHSVDWCSIVLCILCMIRLHVENRLKPYNSDALSNASWLALLSIFIVSFCNLAMAIIEKTQYRQCGKDTMISILAYIIDIFTVYIPALFVLLFTTYASVCIVMKLFNCLNNIQ